ncbi:hypothetical protein [Streptomyces sp. NPDC051452]|uniref:hypothetical protein n=1 Tax=Streptomyces sp. NPDC051452 TaxID=3365654 RepID=UPI0037B44360
MSRRWWIRQALMTAGIVAFSVLSNVVAHRSWQVTVGWALGVVLLVGLSVLNVLWLQRYRPEKFEQYRAKAEARYQR